MLENKIKSYELQINNAPYEYGKYIGPQIKSAKELLKLIIKYCYHNE